MLTMFHGSLRQMQAALSRREVSSLELTRACLTAMEQQEPLLNAFLTRCPERAEAEARHVDEARARGETLPPLAGIPMALKDNLCVRGLPTTCASRMLERYVPAYDATAYLRLRGCPLLGKTNMDEFGMGSTTENSAFSPTRNPLDPQRVPGGSSGGSAACVAAGEAPFSLGSDTGGSIRQPAAFCGVVGMKPTYGRVSRYGLVAFASSLDQIGPMTRTVADNALVLDALAGHDPRDATSLPQTPPSMGRDLSKGVQGLRLGLPREFFAGGLSAPVRSQVLHAARLLESAGAVVEEVSLPSLVYALPAYYLISSAEASSNLARFDGVRYGRRAPDCADLDALYVRSRSEGFGTEVKRRILLGTYILSAGAYEAYYRKALQARTLILRDFSQALSRCDALLGPVTPSTACRLGEKAASPMAKYLGNVYTVPVSLAGLPALSMPCGADAKGLPIGIQLIGAACAEPMLYRIGAALEALLGKEAG